VPPASPATRLASLPRGRVAGRVVPVAVDWRSRLLGLSHLDRSRAGSGLLIPSCASVHTFGMRFDLDLYFLDRHGRVRGVRRAVPPRRLLWDRGASAVLEVPSAG
jgi:uncharacterized protein